MDEISKIGDINSVNDLLDFKLSVKTIMFLVIAWAGLCGIIFIIIMGGVNNSIAYLTTMMNSTKDVIIKIKEDSVSKGSGYSSPTERRIAKQNNNELSERAKTDEDD